jgi:hypothetical protein
MQTLIVIVSALALTACAASTKAVVRPALAPVLDPPPAELQRPCADPTKLPAGAMTQRNVERHWSSDRANLRACGARHAAQTKFYRARDSALAGTKR